MIPLLLLSFAAVAQDDVPVPDPRVTPQVRVFQTAAPAVVFIQTRSERPVRNFLGMVVGMERAGGQGSGVVIREEGFIITNFHVVRGAREILVNFDRQFDEQVYRADLVSHVEKEDLALLKISGKRPFPTIPLGRSDDLMPGEPAITIGNPHGQTLTIHSGIISGLHRDVQVQVEGVGVLEFSDLIQTDAGINFGNSGGPLLNIHGQLIGINSVMNVQAQVIGFAIPVDRVRSVLENQLLSPEAAPAWLGLEVEPGDHLSVARVVEGSPAHRAGVRPGDCIVALGGRSLLNQDEFRLARAGVAPLREVELQVERAGTRRRIGISPWERVDGSLYERLGARFEERAFAQGRVLAVTEVRAGGPAAELGLQAGDLIDALRPRTGRWGRPWSVDTRERLERLLGLLEPGSEVEVDVFRDADGDRRFTRDELLRGMLRLP